MDLAIGGGCVSQTSRSGASAPQPFCFLRQVLQWQPHRRPERRPKKLHWAVGVLEQMRLRPRSPCERSARALGHCFAPCCLNVTPPPVQGVTWTGVLNSRRLASGLKVDWAYAPGEVKILTSSDGSNFEEAKCWQSSTRSEVAFEESFMFDTPRNVKAVAITMRSPQSWGYFGINSAALVAEPGPFMLVRRGGIPFSFLSVHHVSKRDAVNLVASHQRMASNVWLRARRVSPWSLAWKPLPRATAGR